MLHRRSCRIFFRRVLASRSFAQQADKGSEHAVIEDVLRPLENFTRRLIDSSAAGNANLKHRDGIKLWSTIPQAAKPNAGVPSMEKAQFLGENETQLAPDVDPLQSDSVNEDFAPGTFIEIRRNRIVTHGVILKLQIIESRRHAITLTYTGEVWPHLMSDITYSIPNFVSQDLMYRSGPAYEAADVAETVARLEVVGKIRTFARQHERHFNSLGKSITTLYDKVRHRDPERWMDVTTPNATRHLDIRKPPPILTLFAMHAHMMDRPLYFVADPRNHKSTHRFSIRPLSHVETILQVNEWVRSYDPAFHSFLQKARVAIRQTRRVRQGAWGGPPTRVKSSLPSWSSSDMIFIRYLQHSMRTRRTIQHDPYEHALPGIVKRLGLYSDRVLDTGLIHTILCELGVLSPWDDVVMRTPELRLDIEPPGESKQGQALNELVVHSQGCPGMPAPPPLKKTLLDAHLEGATELYQRDPYETIRHDFGDLPVYVVDDADAQELDDGLSIEPVVGEKGNHWVHVHIADPTTIIPPGHVFDLHARESAITLYSPHRSWPMLPPTLTHPLFSLGSRRKGDAQEVLTFSVKANDSGDFLDYKIRAGFVRNIQVLQYDQVDRMLGVTHSPWSYPLVGTRQPEMHFAPIPRSHHSDLRKLHHLAQTMILRTIKESPVISFSFPRAGIKFQSALPQNPVLSPDPIFWKGYPSMIYYVENQAESDKTFRRVVAEYMKLACRAASRFCVEKGVPALRRTSAPLHTPSDEDMADLLAMRDSTGYVDPIECIKRNLYAPPGEPSLEPLEHWSLGIPKGEGYTRVTSPLRRYTDLLMHWQIKHELLPVSKRTTSGPLYPSEYLKPVMHQLFDREKAGASAGLLYEKHWTFTCLTRYIENRRRKHGPDFDNFPGLLATTIGPVGYDTWNITGQVLVVIPTLGVKGLLKGLDQKVAIPLGTVIPVKIIEISLGLAPALTLGIA